LDRVHLITRFAGDSPRGESFEFAKTANYALRLLFFSFSEKFLNVPKTICVQIVLNFFYKKFLGGFLGQSPKL